MSDCCCIIIAGFDFRSLGVHLSFVRSVTMDKWKESELAKMKAGGNANMKSFLEDRSAPGGVTKTQIFTCIKMFSSDKDH